MPKYAAKLNVLFQRCGFITRNGASIKPPSNSVLWLSIPRPGKASKMVMLCPASFRILAAASPAMPLPMTAISNLLFHILNFHKIMNHASRKQGIKNYQIQPFSRVDTKQYKWGKHRCLAHKTTAQKKPPNQFRGFFNDERSCKTVLSRYWNFTKFTTVKIIKCLNNFIFGVHDKWAIALNWFI